MAKENLQFTTQSEEYREKLKKANKTKQFNLRLTPFEMDQLGQDAAKAKQPIAQYIVDSLKLNRNL